MLNTRYFFSFIVLITLVSTTAFAQPTISNISPTSGNAGTTVTITGTGFSATPATNTVFLGATQATVNTATTTVLTVAVPSGATFGSISVQVSNLTAESNTHFLPTFVSLSNTITSGTLATKVDFTTLSGPRYVTISDIDGDGKPDLIAAVQGANAISILRNTGSPGTLSLGTFAPKVDFVSGISPRGIVAGDLDGDGKPDVVSVNTSASSVSVFRNTSTSGTISLATKADFTTGSSPLRAVLGDIDADGKLDIIVSNSGSNNISILRNTSTPGSISFAAKVDFAAGNTPIGLAVHDFNSDGKLNVAVANQGSNSVSVLNNISTPGTIILFAGSTLTTANAPSELAIGDLDGDGNVDIATANFGADNVSVLRHTGALSFATKVDFNTGSGPEDLTIVDIDSDGKPDLTVTNSSANTLSLLQNTGSSGTISFAAKVDFTTGTDPKGIAAGDLDGDGKPDLITVSSNTTTLSVFHNLTLAGPIISSISPTSGNVGTNVTITGTDFDPTPANNTVFFGATQAIVTLASTTSLTVTVPSGATFDPISVQVNGLIANSDAFFTPTYTGVAQTIATNTFASQIDFAGGTSPQVVILADIDGDGKSDLITTQGNNASVYHNTSNTGSLSTSSFAAKIDLTTGNGPNRGSVADIDGDGKLDIITPNATAGTVSVLRNTSIPGAISFATKVDIPATVGASWAETSDLDGDGKLDIVVANNAPATISVLRNTSSVGTISFATKVEFSVVANPLGVAIGDIDGDSKPDIAVANNVGTSVSLFRNISTAGTFTTGSLAPRVDITAQSGPRAIEMADIDGDAKPDIVVTNQVTSSVSIFRNIAVPGSITTGSFATRVDATTGTGPIGLALADVDGDGKVDIATSNESTNDLSFFKNNSISGSITLASKVDIGTSSSPRWVTLGDLDGDAKPDIAVARNTGNEVSIFQNIADPLFTDVASSLGLADTGNSRSVSWGDIDNDGDDDLYVSNEQQANKLYRNDGGTFSDITSSAGVTDSTPESHASIWGDKDGDGDLDLFIAKNFVANRLFQNNGGNSFSDVAGSAGVNNSSNGQGATWVDYDKDGDLDIYWSKSGGNILYQNNGSGSFSDVAGAVGVNDGGNGATGTWGDFDDDGDLDLFVGNASVQNNALYQNNNGTFTNIAASAGVNESFQARGADWADYDNDGDLDLFVTDSGGTNDRLYRNNGNSTFSNVNTPAGITPLNTGTGPTWGDYDSDGDVDLIAYLAYQNNGNGTFAEVTTSLGINSLGNAMGKAYADYDADGDLDLYVAHNGTANAFYQNNGNTNRWLHLDLTSTISAPYAIGTTIYAVTGSHRQRWFVDGGSGWQSQGSGFVEFGFGSTSTVDSLIIEWPSGLVQTQTSVSTNQVLAITEQGQFTDIASSAGVDQSGLGGSGMAWGDYDNDGFVDFFRANSSVGKLYRNNGNSTFTDQAVSAGVAATKPVGGVAWGDFDNDGDIDLYLGRGENTHSHHLYRNEGNGTFSEIGASSGINTTQWSTTVSWADFDNDGDLDIYVESNGQTDKLYRNNGNSSFTDIAAAAGTNDGSDGIGAAWGDLDNDGDLDIYLATGLGHTSKLYRNNGNSTFTEIGASASVNHSGASRGVALADYNHDGFLDLYVSSEGQANRLYRNNGNLAFSDEAGSAGVDYNGNSLGISWADYDNDGDLDLHVADELNANRLFKNDNNGTFVEVASQEGLADPRLSRTANWADFDNDGDLDLYVSNGADPAGLYQNTGNTNAWLSATLSGELSNKNGIGARITAVTGLLRQIRELDGGSGYVSQSSLPVEFGFGTTTTIDSLIIQWPSGITWDTTNVATNQILALTEFVELVVTVPDTVSSYTSTINVPVRIEGAANKEIVAAEINLAYDSRIITSAVTEITGTLVAAGWSVEENIFQGSGDIDTLSIAMSTAQDTLSSDGDLILLTLQTADIRHPDSTDLELTKVLFNDGTPLSTNNSGSLKLIGTDGTIAASPDSINPGDVVTITVTDADLDLDVGNPDQVTATAVSKGYNDSQSVTLTETGANTGIFTGSVNTIFALAAGPSEDGVITTIAGDSICVSFVDSLTSVGTTVTRYDTVEVIGGVDGEILASFVVQSLDSRNGVRDTVRVQVTDSDLDTDVGLAEQVSATITNNVSGESEAVTLTETGVNTGIFQVRVPTISGASGTNNDGELSLASEDTLTATYVDALTSQGGSSPIQDDTQVVNLFGDVRSNDNIQAFDAASILAHAVSLNTYTARDSLLGDVDGNGDVQAFDASKVLQYVVRLIDRFPVQTDDSITPPGDLKNHPFLKPVPLNQIIALGELQPQGDGTHLLPISLTDRQGILSATLELNHSEHMQILAVTPDAAYDGFMVAHNAEKDRVRIAFAGTQSHTSGSGNILYLHIKAIGKLQFSLDHVVLNGHTLTPSAPLEAVTQIEPTMPLVYALHQNQPNPFNPETVIRYDLPEASDIHIVVYNVMGQQIKTLISERREAGAHHIVWDAKDAFGRNIGSGVYFIQMNAKTFQKTRKMLLLR